MRPPAVIVVPLCVVVCLSGCSRSRGDEHAEAACRGASTYVNGGCAIGVTCWSPGDRAVRDSAIDEAMLSATADLHEAVSSGQTPEARIAAIIDWCGITRPSPPGHGKNRRGTAELRLAPAVAREMPSWLAPDGLR